MVKSIVLELEIWDFISVYIKKPIVSTWEYGKYREDKKVRE